jgi:large subunit ribosomal protein L21
MFAVIKTGGKQYKVSAEDEILIEKLEVEPGGTVTFEDVLMLGDGETVTVGAPKIDGATVRGEVVEQAKGPKVVTIRKRRRKHSSQRRRGHRQKLTRVRVTEIVTA